MNQKELIELELVARAEAKKKELIEANRLAANTLLLRMLSSMNAEVLDISIGKSCYE